MGIRFKDEAIEVLEAIEMGEDAYGAVFKIRFKHYIFGDRVRYVELMKYVTAEDELEAYQKARRGEWRGLR